jgi:probable F420-dependent oxidoreductase
MKIDASLMVGEIAGGGPMAADLERQGFSAAWSFEGPHDPFFPLVMAAEATERIELGTSIAVAFARNPMICAHIGWDLQAHSKGRFILGLGTQIKPHIVKRFGQEWSKPAARMREFALAIRAIWACWEGDGRLDFRGEFYNHTLMTPVFNPGPNPFGSPPLFVAGVGPRMVEAVGEVADGLFVHPFHSPEFMAANTLPALERGLETGARKRENFQISCQTIVAIGSNDEEIASARQKAKGQLSFYGSTPAYRGVLDLHGYGDLQPELNRMSKQGKWLEMITKIDDDLFDILAVSGTPTQAGEKLAKRNAFAERSTLMLYNDTDADAVTDVIAAAQGT